MNLSLYVQHEQREEGTTAAGSKDKKARVIRSPSLPQHCSVRVAPKTDSKTIEADRRQVGKIDGEIIDASKVLAVVTDGEVCAHKDLSGLCPTHVFPLHHVCVWGLSLFHTSRVLNHLRVCVDVTSK